MKADQSPVPVDAAAKDHFEKDPEAAHVTLKAQGHVGQSGTCKLDTGKPGVEAGPHPAVGGDPNCACPGDMLLESLVSCAGVTLSQMATAMEISLRGAVIRAEGDLDFRGLLGSKDVPVGLQAIRLHFDVDSDATEEQLAMLARLTQRYCIVSRTLTPLTTLTFAAVPFLQ